MTVMLDAYDSKLKTDCHRAVYLYKRRTQGPYWPALGIQMGESRKEVGED